MNDIDSAIKGINSVGDIDYAGLTKARALLEQLQERENGCDCCNNHLCITCAYCSSKNTCKTCKDKNKYAPNKFCPNCGRDLSGDKNVESNPLTLEQLRLLSVDERPVWVKSLNEDYPSGYGIVVRILSETNVAALTTKHRFEAKDYNKTWIAYFHKPMGDMK